MAATFERASVSAELARTMIGAAEAGYPVKISGAVVGGIGVSGGHYSQDMEVAKAGLSVVGDPA